MAVIILTDLSIIRRSYYVHVTLKNFEFLNFVAEGYRRKLNHGENFPIYVRYIVSTFCNQQIKSRSQFDQTKCLNVDISCGGHDESFFNNDPIYTCMYVCVSKVKDMNVQPSCSRVCLIKGTQKICA